MGHDLQAKRGLAGRDRNQTYDYVGDDDTFKDTDGFSAGSVGLGVVIAPF